MRKKLNPSPDHLPWSDCKVAFDVNCNEELLWDAFLPRKAGFALPIGWSISETNCIGARQVIVFRVTVPPTITDGNSVRQMLDMLAV
jgi:hypothetical protein